MPREPDDGDEPMSTAIEKLIVSRRKTIATLEAEIAEYQKQADAFAIGSPAREALASVIRVKGQRLVSVTKELKGFEEAVKDPRQAEMPGVRKAGSK